MAEIMALASGQPVARIRAMLADFGSVRKAPADVPLTEAEYAIQRAKLMAELPAIRAWMQRGGVVARNDPSLIREMVRRAASRN
jgi:hypothetical protein